MSTFNFPPSRLTPREADELVRERCERLGLDLEKIRPALRTGGTAARIALMTAEEATPERGGPWPPSHIRAARSLFRANTEQGRQVALDDLEAACPEVLARIGRAVVEWSGIDPDSGERIELLAEAIGFSSMPEASRQIADALSEQENG